jgi:hypothetical protein
MLIGGSAPGRVERIGCIGRVGHLPRSLFADAGQWESPIPVTQGAAPHLTLIAPDDDGRENTMPRTRRRFGGIMAVSLLLVPPSIILLACAQESGPRVSQDAAASIGASPAALASAPPAQSQTVAAIPSRACPPAEASSAQASPATAARSPHASSDPSASGLLTIHEGDLAPGWYTTTAFQPVLRFRLGDGWRAYFQDDSDEIAFDRSDGTGFLAITRVTRVIDRVIGNIPVPDDLMGWLALNPAFCWAGPPTSVTMGGLTGSMIDGRVKPGLAPTDIFAYETGNMRVVGGDRIRYYILPLDGPDLTIVLTGTHGEPAFTITHSAATVTLDSLEIAPP